VKLRRRAEPPVPISSADAERLGRLPVDAAFVTGNGFAGSCRHVFNYAGLTENEAAETDWWFCKVDHVDWLLERHAPRSEFVLVSHNGDEAIGPRHSRSLRRRGLRAWLAANVELRHPKLIPIPLGIANPGWEHGDPTVLREGQGAAKRELFDVSFSLDTNPEERRYCLEQTGLELAPRLPHREYVQRLAAAHFCVSPSGNGIDTHRTWEALYLHTVPVVLRGALADEWSDLPLVVLDDWAEFRTIDFSPELYDRLMQDWDPASLSMDAVIARLHRRVASLA
jgi:hypothetical protein